MLPLKTEVLATTSPIPPWQKSEDLSPRKGQGRAPDARAPPTTTTVWERKLTPGSPMMLAWPSEEPEWVTSAWNCEEPHPGKAGPSGN